jgi:hypothetical protein
VRVVISTFVFMGSSSPELNLASIFLTADYTDTADVMNRRIKK